MDNVAALKGYSVRFKSHGISISPIYSGAPPNAVILFTTQNVIQIWQDTVVDTVVFDVRVANASDTWWAPLYKVDMPNKQMVLEDYWEMTPSTTGRISITKSTPITLTQGTYMLGQIALNRTAQTLRLNHTFSTSAPKGPWFDPKGNRGYNIRDARANINMPLAVPAITSAADLPASELFANFSGMTGAVSSYPFAAWDLIL